MSSSSTRERPKAFTREPFFSGVPQAPCAVRASAEVCSWLFFSSLTRLCPLRYYPPLLLSSSNIPTRFYNLNLKEGGSGRSSLGGRWGNPTRAIPLRTSPQTDPNRPGPYESEEKKKKAKKGCFSHDFSVILIFNFLTRAAASFLSLSWAFELVLYRLQIQMALRLPENLPEHLPAACCWDLRTRTQTQTQTQHTLYTNTANTPAAAQNQNPRDHARDTGDMSRIKCSC